MNKVNRAIIMAAGLGNRLRPVTNATPKPLVKVLGKPIIEGIIEALLAQGIVEIHIVVGYLAEQFDYLVDKYQGVELIYNTNYLIHNNISSLYAARDYIGEAIILDGDLIINEEKCLSRDFELSGYNAVWTDNYTDEWLMEVSNGLVKSCSRNGGEHGWQLYSISRWTLSDGIKLKKLLEKEYIEKNNTQIYWDDVAMFCYPEEFDMGVVAMKPGDVQEIDCIEELMAIDNSYVSIIEGVKYE